MSQGRSNWLAALKEDLAALVDRGERPGRPHGLARPQPTATPTQPRGATQPPEPEMADAGAVRVRSQAERDLLKALRVTR